MGGHVPAAVTLMDEMLNSPLGKVRVIGIFSDTRLELMPEIDDGRAG